MKKVTVIDKIEILERGHIQVRRATYLVEDDGTRTMLGSWHRVAYAPGQHIDTEDEAVKRYAAFAWTPEVVAAHRAFMEAQTRGRGAPPLVPEGS